MYKVGVPNVLVWTGKEAYVLQTNNNRTQLLNSKYRTRVSSIE